MKDFVNKENSGGGWEEFQREIYLETVRVVAIEMHSVTFLSC